ncbi:hypothetical protein FEM48_Zijuj10G0109300 [Ziziphus jujuba var. spinosa]|uniref:Uncharacterized protein n=1 Tax=Ziziphus jujuba var. spinosa TaxID=714518 RepID=A0A978UMZ0_ZIZJJ|nr:hypothetical protein FEM48_Zijuj10G0109300 [Ziziphus jujuba var. spinosa]
MVTTKVNVNLLLGHLCPLLVTRSNSTRPGPVARLIGDEGENLSQGDDQDVNSKISFHTIVGTDHSQTLQVTGRIRDWDLMVLIDRGSSHNFIDQSVLQKLGLLMNHNKKFSVSSPTRNALIALDYATRFLYRYKDIPSWLINTFV